METGMPSFNSLYMVCTIQEVIFSYQLT